MYYFKANCTLNFKLKQLKLKQDTHTSSLPEECFQYCIPDFPFHTSLRHRHTRRPADPLFHPSNPQRPLP